ncbi:kinesin-domain-containing protein [Basidiobolus meristosporus CBS 931.73]|uniref:Kinesin-like protein n=1 Tax=Basidiobolus meristosporus CBS 931.73 TaxID=1314790 RepID=A0A1Y1YU38_9FUNG|nr:kinesin-domain-containing protein [Basidiobolus meristosporus CBS 931.73]|eukprot:ORY01550.1 kinesin-domain-containing protein [Basidiobolus meristosporus CBS 931.73]
MVGPSNHKTPNETEAILATQDNNTSADHALNHSKLFSKLNVEDLENLQSTFNSQSLNPSTFSRYTCDQAQFNDFEELRKQIEQCTNSQPQCNDTTTPLSDDLLQEEMNKLKTKFEEQCKKYTEDIQKLTSQHESHLDSLHKEYENLEKEKDTISSQLDDAQSRIHKHKQKISNLKSTISTQSEALSQLQTQQSATQQQLEETSCTLESKLQDIDIMNGELSVAKSYIAELEAKLRAEEASRRKLHNTIQELKGNIRVFCRMRPLLGPEQMEDPLQINFIKEDEIELIQSQESANGSKTVTKSYPFTFDKIFEPKATQSEVFEEISQLVQSALDGYPVCIFAYGQTGSGKTFTMEGPDFPDSDTIGIIPRAVLQIYSTVESLKLKGWEYVMEGQFLEIYNDTINDLLGNGDFNKKHDIRHLPNGKTIVSDLTTVTIDSPEKMKALMKRAGQNRAVASTQCNDRSSRSHSVFMLKLSGKNTYSGEVSEGMLNLIDLAGSERLSQSGSTGDRLRETQAINKSLSCLGDVIYSIANNEAHVPYRNSKLTYLLQNSLGGNSKTLMFVNISSCNAHFQETLCSLRFATKVNSCHIGVAKRITK